MAAFLLVGVIIDVIWLHTDMITATMMTADILEWQSKSGIRDFGQFNFLKTNQMASWI